VLSTKQKRVTKTLVQQCVVLMFLVRMSGGSGCRTGLSLARTEDAEEGGSPTTSLHGRESASAISEGAVKMSGATIIGWQAKEIPRYDCRSNRHGMTLEGLLQ
jgi:hypothetical protein